MASEVQYSVLVTTGSSNNELSNMANGIENVTGKTKGLSSVLDTIGTGVFVFNQIGQAIKEVSGILSSITGPGVELNDSLMDLKAITGATDDQLKQIKQSARDTAKAFGVDAAEGVEAYKVVLSKLGPELAQQPKALALMGEQITVLSKQMGNDTVGASNLLTTAMNQFGVSTENPIEAARTMGVMMNIMSKAAQEGSAEMPQIQSALEQAGMMAKTSNVSFAETNAAIQVLDKAGKKGAEGGVAIRNLLAEMSLGVNQPKAVAEGMQALGVDLDKLTDKSLTFTERLKLLRPAMQDQSLLTQMVGVQNVSATMALIENVDEMERLTGTIVDSNSAYEMADTKMESYKERMSVYWAKIKDIGIGFFDTIQPIVPFFSIVGAGIGVVGQLGTAISAVSTIMNTKLGLAMKSAATATWGFVRASLASLANLVRTGAMAVFAGGMLLGSFVSSLVTATAAQLGLNIAMIANPIGLFVVGIAAVVGIVALLIVKWDSIIGGIKAFGKLVIGLVNNIFPGFKDKMKAVFDWVSDKFAQLVDWIKKSIGWIKSLFGGKETMTIDYTGDIAGITMPNATTKNEKITSGSLGLGNKGDSKSTAENIASGGNRPTNINVTVQKFQDKTEIHTMTAKDGINDMEAIMKEMFLRVLNSATALQTR